MGVIYKIINSVDDRTYVGSTINFNERRNEHLRDLKNGNHHNHHLQRFYNKYGNCLSFIILEECDNHTIHLREQFWLDITETKFNISDNTTAPMLGRKHSPETIKLYSNNRKGVKNSMYGKKRTTEDINKMIAGSIGRKMSKDEIIQRMINCPHRKEIILSTNGVEEYCFSIGCAAKLLKVTYQSVSTALKNKSKCKGWCISKAETNIFTFSNLNKIDNYISYFDDEFSPQPELLNLIKRL